MHETGLVRAAVKTVVQAAERDTGRVRSVHLGLGVTDELDAESVKTMFAAMGADSVCSGAEVEVDDLEATTICRQCGMPRSSGECECPACGAVETRFGVPVGLSVLSITMAD